MSDLARWQQVADEWPGRLQLLAQHILPGSRVVDVGAGAQGLRRLLPAGCTYVPVDVVARTPDTVVLDLDTCARLPRGDVLVLAGVMEYVADPARLLRLAHRAARLCLLTYAHNRASQEPADGWVNALHPAQLRRMALAARWATVTRLGKWEGQLLWRLGGQTMAAHWCKGCGGGRNYGDQLTPQLLPLVGVNALWAPMAAARLVGCGSILSKLPPGWTGQVLGTGLIREGMHRDLSRAHVLAVRGTYTRDACKLPASTPLGDLGLLVDRLLPRDSPRAVHPVAVLPHSVDHGMAARHPDAQVFSILDPPAQVVANVASCSLLYTSSLHGLITADVLGVPHVWEPHPAVTGGAWKFLDYASAVGSTVEPGVVRLSPRGAVAEAQQQLAMLLGKVG